MGQLEREGGLNIEGDIATIDFNVVIYRLAAVKKAAYKFGDRFHVHISLPDEKHIAVTLKPRGECTSLIASAGEFGNEVLDQELRECVAQETEAVRNLILAQAFSKTSLVDRVGDTSGYGEDPLNIRQPRA